MQKFFYTAKNSDGKVVKAVVEAFSVGEAAKLLTGQNLFPLTIEPYKPKLFTGHEGFRQSLTRIKPKDRVLFTRQLAILIKAGIPLAKALQLLQNQLVNPKMTDILATITTKVEGGQTLSQSLAEHPKVFNTIYINMVMAGETSGTLEDTLQRLAAQEEKTRAINTKIKHAFTYPVVVLVVLVLVSILMIMIVLPQVGRMYSELNQQVPLMTRILLAIAAVIKKLWVLLILVFAGSIAAVRYYVLVTEQGRRYLDRLKLKVPVFKTLITKVYMARFSRTLSSLVNSGVPMLKALHIVADSMNNIYLKESVNKIAERVKGGEPLSKPVGNDPYFLPLVGQMLEVGEQTGSIGDSLNKVAAYFEDEVDTQIKSIQTLIEPATMVLLGGMVMFLVGAVLLPIYGLVSAVR